MLGRHKALILIPTILLIPVFLGMTPLNMAHRLATGCPLVQGKTRTCNANPFHSLTSHDHPTIVNLNLNPQELESTPTFHIQVLALSSIQSSMPFVSPPLRC